MEDCPPPQAWRRSPREISGRVIVSGLALGHAVFHWVVQSLVVLLPEVQQAFNLSAVGVGGILSARELSTGLVKLPAGVASDLLRRHWGRLLGACLLVAAIGTLVLGAASNYLLLLGGMVTVAVAHSTWHLPAAALLSRRFRHRKGTALAFHGVGGGIGDVFGPMITGALLAFLTWRGLLGVYALAALAVGAMILWALRSSGLGGDNKQLSLSGQLRISRRLLRRPILWGLALVYGLRAMALVALLSVMPLYLDNQLAMRPAVRGLHIGMLITVGLVAKPLAGYLSDRLGRKQVLIPGLAWSSLAALALTVFDVGISLTTTVFLLGLFLYPDQPVLTASVLDVVEPAAVNTGLAVVSVGSALMGAASPLIAGYLYESRGFHATAYYVSALFALAAFILAALPLVRSQSRNE